MHAAEERHVKLASPIPVYLGYWTATATNEGVEFRGDVYGIDSRQAAKLADRLARQRKTVVAGRAMPAAKAGSSD